MAADLPFSAPAERNSLPILAALASRIPSGARVLEIGSGTGQHCCRFASELEVASWQPTDLADALDGLTRRVTDLADPRLLAPMVLDVANDDWPPSRFDLVYTANTFHIMSWAQVLDCLRGVSEVLESGGLLVVYGPFRDGEQHNAPSNDAFDQSLRARVPHMGIRDRVEVEAAALAVDLEKLEEIEMPANNRLLLFRSAG
jgi:SAM-dependent methyltransferase